MKMNEKHKFRQNWYRWHHSKQNDLTKKMHLITYPETYETPSKIQLFHPRSNYSKFNISIPLISSSRPRVASAGIAKRNQFDRNFTSNLSDRQQKSIEHLIKTRRTSIDNLWNIQRPYSEVRLRQHLRRRMGRCGRGPPPPAPCIR